MNDEKNTYCQLSRVIKKTKQQQQQPKMGKIRPESVKLFKMFRLYYKKRVFL